jgi:cyclopropane fatty-acyl-phospholipid synthase-like methyltransferase
MFDQYMDIFDERGDSYNAACRLYPDARIHERQHIIDRLELSPGLRLCDLPAGGGYVVEGIYQQYANDIDYICIEPSNIFSSVIQSTTFQLVTSAIDHIALVDTCVDRIASLAGIHHIQHKQSFFSECARTLKTGGIFVIGDVLQDTAIAHFLNTEVNRYSNTGHRGYFLKPRELTARCEKAGLAVCEEVVENFIWDFPSETAMTEYCYLLFGMEKANPDEVNAAIHRHLRVTTENSSVQLHWSLVYAKAIKPD